MDDSAFVFGNNRSVLCNKYNLAYTLKKKNNIIAFHHVSDGVSQDEWRTAYVNTYKNLVYLFMKPLSGEAVEICAYVAT